MFGVEYFLTPRLALNLRGGYYIGKHEFHEGILPGAYNDIPESVRDEPVVVDFTGLRIDGLGLAVYF